MGGEADDRVGAEDLPRLLGWHVVLSQVDPVGVAGLRQVGIVVDDEQGAVGVAEAAEDLGRALGRLPAQLLLTQLNDVAAAVQRGVQQRFGIRVAGKRVADEIEARRAQPLTAQGAGCLRECQAHTSIIATDPGVPSASS